MGTITVYEKDKPLILIEKATPIEVKSTILSEIRPIMAAKLRRILPENITVRNLEHFLESRSPDKYREDLDYILKRLNLKSYNPYWICRRTHAVSATDFIWLKFDDEKVSYDDVKLR